MKKILLFTLVLLITTSFAQQVTVLKTEALTTETDGEYCFPRMDKQGNKIFFSSPNYMGLYVYDLKEKKIVRLTEESGAGYHFDINKEGTEVVYRTFKIINGRRYFSLLQHNLLLNKKTVLEKEQRNLSVPCYLQEQKILYALDRQIKQRRLSPKVNKNKQQDELPFVYIEDKKIALFAAGVKTILQPRGEGSYIWPEISPDDKKLLFKKLGDGCYISDLKGNIEVSLGNINAPHWSPDGKWVVYMADIDDGYRLLSSEIHIKNIESLEDITLTDTDNRKEVYPRWGADMGTIIFASERGQLYLMHLKWN